MHLMGTIQTMVFSISLVWVLLRPWLSKKLSDCSYSTHGFNSAGKSRRSNRRADKNVWYVDTSPERCVPGVGFMLISAVLCLQSQFEDGTLCTTKYSKILPLRAIWQKISMHYRLLGKAKLSMDSCIEIFGLIDSTFLQSKLLDRFFFQFALKRTLSASIVWLVGR